MGIDKRILTARFVFMFMLSVLLLISHKVGASTVDRRPDVELKLLNNNMDSNLKELVYYLKNNNTKAIRIKRTTVEKMTEGHWKELERNKNAKVQQNINISSGETKFDNIMLYKIYNIGEEGVEAGKYRINIKYKYRGKTYYGMKAFKISKTEVATDPEDTDDSSQQTTANNNSEQGNVTDTEEETTIKAPVNISKPSEGTDKVCGTESSDIILKLQDFNISKKGEAKSLVYFETNSSYKITDKIVIRIKIQKRRGGKWKKYKIIRVRKNSNVAYANKKFKIKSSGTYRMKVTIFQYQGKDIKGKCSMNPIIVRYKKQ